MQYGFKVSDCFAMYPVIISIEMTEDGDYEVATDTGSKERFASLDEAIDGILMVWSAPRYTVTLIRA